jgi:hypothetical protein
VSLWLRDRGTDHVRDRNNLIAFTIKAARSMPGRGSGDSGGSKWLSAARAGSPHAATPGQGARITFRAPQKWKPARKRASSTISRRCSRDALAVGAVVVAVMLAAAGPHEHRIIPIVVIQDRHAFSEAPVVVLGGEHRDAAVERAAQPA